MGFLQGLNELLYKELRTLPRAWDIVRDACTSYVVFIISIHIIIFSHQ